MVRKREDQIGKEKKKHGTHEIRINVGIYVRRYIHNGKKGKDDIKDVYQ
jgi:hypothetical protein